MSKTTPPVTEILDTYYFTDQSRLMIYRTLSVYCVRLDILQKLGDKDIDLEPEYDTFLYVYDTRKEAGVAYLKLLCAYVPNINYKGISVN
jgi:hypothetical protein